MKNTPSRWVCNIRQLLVQNYPHLLLGSDSVLIHQVLKQLHHKQEKTDWVPTPWLWRYVAAGPRKTHADTLNQHQLVNQLTQAVLQLWMIFAEDYQAHAPTKFSDNAANCVQRIKRTKRGLKYNLRLLAKRF